MNRILIPFFFAFSAGFLTGQETAAEFADEIYRHREHYKQEFLTDSRAPLTAQDTALLDFFPPNVNWRITARFERTPDAEPFDMPTYSGRSKPFVRFGYAHFEIAGQAYRLALYQNLNLVKQEEFKDYLFLPFRDHGNGDNTYGGGRYLDFRADEIAGDRVVIDFNKAYNPWCAYSDGYNCPIPPAENHLELAVEAGEKNYRGEKKH